MKKALDREEEKLQTKKSKYLQLSYEDKNQLGK